MSERRLLDLKDAAVMLGIDYRTARLYVAKGLLAAVRFPSLAGNGPRRKIQVTPEAVDAFIKAHESVPFAGPNEFSEASQTTHSVAQMKRDTKRTKDAQGQWYDKYRAR